MKLNYKNYTIKIINDVNAEDPRNDCNLGTMICWHSRYNIGDKHSFEKPGDANNFFNNTNAIVLPVFMYDHSGFILSTDNTHYPFNDQWDAGQVGYIYVEKNNIEKMYGVCNDITIERAKEQLRSEVEQYSKWSNNKVYGYVTRNASNEEVDSCWGYYSIDDCEADAKAVIDNML